MKEAMMDEQTVGQKLAEEDEATRVWGPRSSEARMQRLCALFPSLRDAPGARPWNVGQLMAWSFSGALGSGGGHALRFVLSVWDFPPDEQDPLVGPCKLADVVIDVPSQNPGALLGAPQLVDSRPFGDYRPVQSPETLSCCLRTAAPGPSRDFAGARRTYPLATLGAYEVVR